MKIDKFIGTISLRNWPIR